MSGPSAFLGGGWWDGREGGWMAGKVAGWQGRWLAGGMAGKVAGQLAGGAVGAGGAGVSAASLPCIAGMFLWGPSCHQSWDKPLQDASPQPCPWPAAGCSTPFHWVSGSCPLAQSTHRVSSGKVWLRHS